MRLNLIFLLLFNFGCMNQEVLENCKLQGLEKECSTHIGSIKRLQIVRPSEIISLPEPEPGALLIEGEIALRPEAGFVDYEFLINQAEFSEQTQTEKGVTTWAQQISVTRQGISAEAASELLRLTDGQYVAIVTLYTGARRLVGNQQNPLLFAGSDKTNLRQAEAIKAQLVFSRAAASPAPFLSDSFIVPVSSSSYPLAVLSVSRPDECSPAHISLGGSQRMSSQLINNLTPNQVVLEYAWGPSAAPYYKARINPSSDPTLIGSWTWITGSRGLADFETRIVDNITGVSTAVSFFVAAKDLEAIDPSSSMDVSLTVYDQGVGSNTASAPLRLYHTVSSFGQYEASSIAMFVISKSDCSVGFNDGTQFASFELFANTLTPISASPGSSSLRKFQLYSPLGSISDITVVTGNVKDFQLVGALANGLRGLGFSTGAHDLGHFSLRSMPGLVSFSAPNSGILSLDYSQNPGLSDLEVSNNSISGAIDLTGLPNLGQGNWGFNSITSVKLGGRKANLSILDFESNQLSASALDDLVEELWQMRAAASALVDLRLNPGSGSMDSATLDKINGTGSYTGEGLVSDYGWTIDY